MIERIDEPTGEEAYLAMEITRRRLEFEKTLEPLVKRMTELQQLRMPKYVVEFPKLPGALQNQLEYEYKEFWEPRMGVSDAAKGDLHPLQAPVPKVWVR